MSEPSSPPILLAATRAAAHRAVWEEARRVYCAAKVSTASVTPRPFRVGDRVRVVRRNSVAGLVSCKAGEQGSIVYHNARGETDDFRAHCWLVALRRADGRAGWHSDDELELVEAAPEGHG